MGTIAEKLTYLNGTKSSLKTAINNLGGDIDNNTTFRNYATELNDIYDNLPKVSDTGTNVGLSPTLKGRLGIVPKGNTLQDGEPTPSTPVEIQNATGTQNVVVSGKNLFDISTISENTYLNTLGETGTSSASNVSDYIEVIGGGSYYLSFDYQSLISTGDRAYCYYDENKTYISGNAYTITNKNATFSIPNNAKYIRFAYDKNCTNVNFIETPVEKTVELGNIELNKIGDYEDYIDGTPDNWVLYKNIGKVVLDGSESWGTIGNNRYWVAFSDKRGLTSQVPCLLMSNYFKATQYAGGEVGIGEMTEGYYTIANYNVFFNYNGTNTDLAGFKTWLSTHNTEVLYVLATETTETITDTNLISQLNELYYLMSYDDTTNIDVTGNLPMRITASAIKGA